MYFFHADIIEFNLGEVNFVLTGVPIDFLLLESNYFHSRRLKDNGNFVIVLDFLSFGKNDDAHTTKWEVERGGLARKLKWRLLRQRIAVICYIMQANAPWKTFETYG